MTHIDGTKLSSGFVMFPSGHAANTAANLKGILDNKFQNLGKLAIQDEGLLNKYWVHCHI